MNATISEYVALAIATGIGAYLVAQGVGLVWNVYVNRVLSIVPTF